ncbi:MAG: hypothetical protein ABIR54_06560 [Burkholderiaceae bacterium]
MAVAVRRPFDGVAQIGSITIASETADTVTVVFSGQRRIHDFEKIEEQWEFWPATTQRCRTLGIRRVLVLNELAGPISSNYVRDFHINLDRFGLGRDIRYALVVGDPRSRSVLSLGIALAKEAGWDIEIFEEQVAAEAWLARALG